MPGSGWLGETVQAFSLFGEHEAAVRLVRAMAPVYDRGPGGQSHQIFSRNARYTRTLDRPRKFVSSTEECCTTFMFVDEAWLCLQCGYRI